MIDRETYCMDCERSIYAENPSCDVNIENNGRYTNNSKCYCKIINGKMAEKYPWNIKEGEQE